MPIQCKKIVSIITHMKAHPDVFREDKEIMFYNFCDLSVEWKSKSTVDMHCLSKAHIKKEKLMKIQQNKPVFPFVEGRLEQLTSYLERNRMTQDFGPKLHSFIIQLRFNPDDFYAIFHSAFNLAYNKFKTHIP
ncbi:hypothetical protein C1645_834736 [Glomus cerebriforme]|uniref:Uncharacterized protein n=1 Tax=Glomus cerebriforme TaxID=658196 RepID=A0A397SDP6_9GLOM|nr:hypothetical protein C1645_834736 [Glomus cerebriforme]